MEFSHEQLLIIAEWLDSGNRYKFLLFFFIYLFVYLFLSHMGIRSHWNGCIHQEVCRSEVRKAWRAKEDLNPSSIVLQSEHGREQRSAINKGK